MLVTFKTKAYADITLFGDIGLAMLKMMGYSATVPGAILAEDVPVALNRLTAAIANDNATLAKQNKDQEETSVSMAHRALPLIELLTAAAKSKCNVMWD